VSKIAGSSGKSYKKTGEDNCEAKKDFELSSDRVFMRDLMGNSDMIIFNW
jgi:hypothetical protein